MENARKWFGRDDYIPQNEVDRALDELLFVYYNALLGYFSLENSDNISDFIENALNKVSSQSDKMFIKWFKEKGYPYLNELVFICLPNENDFIAQIEYEKYILDNEMKFGITEDLRSLLVDIIEEMPNRIKHCDDDKLFSEESALVGELEFESNYNPRLQEIAYDLTNDKQVCKNAGLYFDYWRYFNEF